ncbi:hypothetical protein B296_00043821 [Ensete ventricosum]|uniref:Uncharacterized protein n=1 Tax=Ensete ventricosum TaxID=4639 RepID=A0A426YWY9_ENSVE|nr:hypothetical protein B296_00043821 [Ensete ventricosum]
MVEKKKKKKKKKQQQQQPRDGKRGRQIGEGRRPYVFFLGFGFSVRVVVVVGWRRCVLHGTRSSYVRIVEALDTTYVKRKLEDGGRSYGLRQRWGRR